MSRNRKKGTQTEDDQTEERIGQPVQLVETLTAPILKSGSRESILTFLRSRETYERRIQEHRETVNEKASSRSLRDSIDEDLLDEICAFELKVSTSQVTNEQLLTHLKSRVKFKSDFAPDVETLLLD